MRNSRRLLFLLLSFLVLLAACGEATPTVTVLNPIATDVPTANAPASAAQPGPAGQPSSADSQTPAPPPVAKAAYCKNGGAITVAANDPLAAKVNGEPIPLSLYQRLSDQQTAALTAQGIDPKSTDGQEAMKGLQEQVLGQLIDNLIVEQTARQQNISVSAQDVDNRIQQMIDDAGGKDKFNDYLKTNQMTLDDLCTQIRSSIFGDLMLNKVTAGMQTKVEQVHAAQILLTSQDDANKVLAELKAGKDFAALAKQYSKDELTRDNGGDLGWFPRGIYPPEFENAAFQLQPGQTSGVVSTALGFHIIKVIERDSARELSADMLQSQKQQAFFAWLDTQRNQAKIEKLVNP